MSLLPVVTYVSVAYTTATEAPNVSQIDLTITTTVLPTPIGMSSIPSPSATTAAISPTSDTTCSTTTSATTLSMSFITSSDTSSSTTFTTSTSSTYSPVPASAALVSPTVSSSPIPLTAEASRPSIDLPGIIGLSAALVIFCAAIITFFCYYRRKRKFHKEAMLLATRLSQHTNHRSIETGDETLVGSSSRGDSLGKGIKLEAMHPKAPVRHASPSADSDAASIAQNTYMPRSSSLTHATARSTEGLGSVMREQRSLGSNIYGIRYNPGGTLSVDYAGAEERHPTVDVNPPGFDEALARLNAIHEAAIRRELSPPPLRIIKRAASNLANQVQPPIRTLLNPTHSDLESISELDISDSPRNRDIERRRAAALAKLEGRSNRYTTESVYSRSSDGTPFNRAGDVEARPQSRNLERHWPD